MSWVGDLLNDYGQNLVPELAAENMPDLMNITGETRTQGAGGGQVKSVVTSAYTNIPVIYEKNRVGMRLVAGDKPVAIGNFLVKFPVYHNGARVNVDANNHKLKILARGLEPVKIFKIRGEPFDNQGVLWEVEAEQES